MMVGFELKALVLILVAVSAIICTSQYEEVWKDSRSYLFGFVESDSGFSPKRSWWIWLFITIGLFNWALYLNSLPAIILF
jgi:hypothetical protein